MDSIAEVMQDLEYLRYMLDGTPDISRQDASEGVYRIIRRLECLTGFDFYPKTTVEERPVDLEALAIF
jgi:hypothetical protein